jgi:hypothetical protein
MLFFNRIAFLLLLLLIASPALAEKRIALVIGNKDYKAGVGALSNPLNDIRIVGEALKSVGFEVLKPVQNATRTEMLAAIYAFSAALKAAGPDAVGFLYYSGHGAASAGENYLIPIDVPEPSTVQLSIQGVKQSEVLAILRSEAPNAAHYLVLDACRNTLQGSRGGKGFVPVGQQSGVLIAFATEPGKTASDLGESSGPYAAALAAELVKPGQNDLIMFHRVRVAVMQKTNRDQVPWTEDGIERPERPVFAVSAQPSPASSPEVGSSTASEVERAWAAIRETKSSVELEIFIRRYGDGFYGDLARQRLAEIRAANDRAAVNAVPSAATPLPPPNSQTAAAAAGPSVAPAGSFIVQIASQNSEEEAQSSFRSLQSKYASQLRGRQPIIVRKDLGSKGIFFSVGVGPFNSSDDAKTLCGSLIAAGGACVVVPAQIWKTGSRNLD